MNLHWKLYDGLYMKTQPGGAILLSNLLRKSLSPEILIYDQNPNDKSSEQKELPELHKYNDFSKVLHANIKLDQFPDWKSDSKNKVYRVRKFYGYTIPWENKDKSKDSTFSFKMMKDDKEANFVLIHDVGNGFRDQKEKWPEAIINGSPIVIQYTNLPLFSGELWEHIIKNHCDRLILILNAEDLRKNGAHISRSLSWEKTALEFLWEMNHNSIFSNINKLPNVIVRFDLEGAIHYSGKESMSAKLFFDPSFVEGGYWDKEKFGSMKGVSAVFTSSFASRLITKFDKGKEARENIKQNISEAIIFGLFKSREFMRKGYGYSEVDQKPKNPEFYDDLTTELFESQAETGFEQKEHIECVDLPNTINFAEPDPDFWSILEDKTKKDKPKDIIEDKKQHLVGVAEKIVIKGKVALQNYPVGYFEKLTSVDRAEIESFRSIKNIFNEYITNEKTQKPLCIAVFGYPGSGKSFGISQVARTIDPDKVINIEFNVSQFISTKDLVNSFHRIRDISLEGKIPLVFFDEFDCEFEGKLLGWVKHFLVPMQDGKFRDYGSMHPIGKSIFVFAGGVYDYFEEFCTETGVCSNDRNDSRTKNKGKRITRNDKNKENNNKKISEKCPDFVSRLKGYVNIIGPNRIFEDGDEAYIIRRAILLRSLIEEKIPNIITKENNTENTGIKRVHGCAKIDRDLLRFLITPEQYIHGARSIEAIIDMSMLKNFDSWQKSSLPLKDQLDLHIKGYDISYLLGEK